MIIKILSYNIHKGKAFFTRRKIWESIDELIHEVNPDIICLQEFVKNKEAIVLLKKLSDEGWSHVAIGTNAISICGNAQGNIILSKFAITEVVNSNISTNLIESRGLLYGKVLIEGKKKPLHLFCTHLDLTAKGRYKQFQSIQPIVSKISKKKESLLLLGDFNDWNKEIHTKIKSEMDLMEVFEHLKGMLVPTSPSILPVLSLDRIYYKSIDPIKAIRVFDKKFRFLSDHLPLVSELRLHE